MLLSMGGIFCRYLVYFVTVGIFCLMSFQFIGNMNIHIWILFQVIQLATSFRCSIRSSEGRPIRLEEYQLRFVMPEHKQQMIKSIADLGPLLTYIHFPGTHRQNHDYSIVQLGCLSSEHVNLTEISIPWLDVSMQELVDSLNRLPHLRKLDLRYVYNMVDFDCVSFMDKLGPHITNYLQSLKVYAISHQPLVTPLMQRLSQMPKLMCVDVTRTPTAIVRQSLGDLRKFAGYFAASGNRLAKSDDIVSIGMCVSSFCTFCSGSIAQNDYRLNDNVDYPQLSNFYLFDPISLAVFFSHSLSTYYRQIFVDVD